MDPEQHLAAIETESARLVDVSEAAGLAAAVPSCPGWTVSDLLGHVGAVQRWQAGIVERRVTEAEFAFDDPPQDPGARLGWVRDATTMTLDAFRATAPDTPIWTFVGPGTAAFWFRRQAHEVAMHRVDAELAAGITPAMDASLALDGIDEFLDIVVGARRREHLTGTGETLHLHCTDVEGEWLVHLTPEGAVVERVHAKGDVAVRGSALDLLLLVRERGGAEGLEVFGDRALLDRFVGLARI